MKGLLRAGIRDFGKTTSWGAITAPSPISTSPITVAFKPIVEFGGGLYAAPVASRIMQEYFKKHPPPPSPETESEVASEVTEEV